MYRSRHRWLLLALLGAICAAFVGCSSPRVWFPSASSSNVRSLSGLWAFHPGDDPSWASPRLDDHDWALLRVPGSWRRQGFPDLTGVAWYRLHVPSQWPPEEILGLTFGRIDSAYELYVGGRRLGGVGALPPNPRMEYDRHQTYSIPPANREPDGSVLVALRVWREPRRFSTAAGPLEGAFEIGPIGRLVDREKLGEAQQLSLLFLFLLVAIYHFSLRFRLGSGADYAWFGTLALLAAIYGFLRTQWKYLIFDDFLVLKKIEHMVLWFIPAAILQFMWLMFSQPRARWLRVTQGALLAGGVIVAAAPGLGLALALLPLLQLSVVPLMVASLAMVITRIAHGDREARIVGVGMAVLGATIAHDALVDRGYVQDPRVAIYGFAVLVVGMSVVLGNRFQRALRDREALMTDLEARVAARTRELSEAYREMEDLASHDGLTQVLNRRAIRDRAASELARAQRHRSSFAIALIDIDHFKKVNDSHGHAAGDQVLAQVARCLVRAVRTSDDVGRWGGEEFLVLLPGTETRNAAAAGERLRSLVAATPVTFAGGVVRTITISVGVVAVDGNARAAEPPDLDALIRAADDALYRAKADGRNTARVADACA
jgi:diguanylate cyclase (GGDEF)-like protein